jgi:hypothetical protein
MVNFFAISYGFEEPPRIRSRETPHVSRVMPRLKHQTHRPLHSDLPVVTALYPP